MMATASDHYTLARLENGLTVVVERMPDVRSAAAGFLVRTGARDEEPPLAGVSHFLEHMMFKGTARRSCRDINVAFDHLGSTYNAFTSEDRTIYYGWVRKDSIFEQIELLADMMQSALPSAEFDTEKNVVLEEIAMSKDNLDHVAIDFLQEKVFAGHSLAWPILGYEQTIRPLSREQMWKYFKNRYAPDNMVLVVAGNVDAERILAAAGQYCGHWQPSGTSNVRTPPRMHGGRDVLVVDRFKQQILALTYPSCSARDRRAETASAVATILGGDNSRYFWNIVQKGIAPRAGAFHMDYTDCGAMILYGVCQPENCEALLAAMRKEAARIGTEGVADHEVQRVKNKRRTSLAVESEAPYYRLTQLMDDMEFHDAPRSVEQMLAEVDAISPATVAEFLGAFPINGEGHLTSVGPSDWPADEV